MKMKPEIYIKSLIIQKGMRKKYIADRLKLRAEYISHALNPHSRHARSYPDEFIKSVQAKIITFLENINP